MSAIENGGPAFPAGYHPEGNSADQHGMTLRDWFAGMALQGMLAGKVPPMRHGDAAGDAYAIADAMIKERNGGGE